MVGLGTLFDAAGKVGWVRPAPAATQAPPEPFFEPVSFDAADLEEYDFVVEGMVQRGLVSLLAAAGGAAKTTMLVGLAVAAAAGRKTFGLFKLRRATGTRCASPSSPARSGATTCGCWWPLLRKRRA